MPKINMLNKHAHTRADKVGYLSVSCLLAPKIKTDQMNRNQGCTSLFAYCNPLLKPFNTFQHLGCVQAPCVKSSALNVTAPNFPRVRSHTHQITTPPARMETCESSALLHRPAAYKDPLFKKKKKTPFITVGR